ncbi:tail fiber domain-containing protein [bacterium]|nr:tail fiber domain-containing protein [bacterium]
MKNQIQLNQIFCSNKNLISRRNQDDTVILMKTDDANIFYKIDGIAANIWHLFQSATNAQDILTALQAKFTAQSSLAQDFSNYISELVDLKLLQVSSEEVPSTKKADLSVFLNNSATYEFGQLKSFNLAQIESEVLNESIYLDVFAGSDLRLKKDVEPLANPLDKIMSLDGISYLWNETAAASAPKTQQIGLVAQQVAAVMPDLVKKDSVSGMLTVNYTKLTPYLVESIKELKNMIDTQNLKISELETEIRKLKH